MIRDCGLIVLLAAAVIGGACGGDKNSHEGRSVAVEDVSAPCTPSTPVDPATAVPLLPRGISLPARADIVKITDDQQQVSVAGRVADTTPTRLKEQFAEQVKAAGYKVDKLDDEGREAEIFFRLDDGRSAVIQQVKSSCPPGAVTFSISYSAKR